MKRDKIRRRVIERLKARAKDAYHRATHPGHMDCGRALADFVCGTDTVGAEVEFRSLLRRLRRIDPAFPNGDAA